MYVIIIITAQKPAENRETGGPRLENDLSSRMEIRGEVISLEEETKKRERTEIILTLLHMREGVHAKLLLHWYREVGEKLITRQGGGGNAYVTHMWRTASSSLKFSVSKSKCTSCKAGRCSLQPY